MDDTSTNQRTSPTAASPTARYGWIPWVTPIPTALLATTTIIAAIVSRNSLLIVSLGIALWLFALATGMVLFLIARQRADRANEEGKRTFPSVEVSFGLFGAVAAVPLTLLLLYLAGAALPSLQPIPVPSSAPTPTLAPSPAAATSLPATPTEASPLIPTSTFPPPATAGPSPTPIPGQDISAGCLYTGNWTPILQYNEPPPLQDERGCVLLADWEIAVQESAIYFSRPSPRSPDSAYRSIYLLLPPRGDITIRFRIRIDELRAQSFSVSSIFAGFGPQSRYRLVSQALYFYAKDWGSQVRVAVGTSPTDDDAVAFPSFDSHSPQDVILTVRGLEMQVSVGGATMPNPILLPQNGREAFWLGFTLPEYGSMSAIITDFAFEQH